MASELFPKGLCQLKVVYNRPMHVHRIVVKYSIEICLPLPLRNAPTNMTESVPEEH